MDLADKLTYLSIILVVLFADNLRTGGAIVYLLCVSLAVLSLSRGISRKTTRDTLVFAGIVLVYVVLSYLRMLPHGWTAFFSKGAIPRQALPLLGFCVMLVSYQRFWSRLLAGKFSDRMLWWVLAVMFLVGPFLDLALHFSPYVRVTGTLRNVSLMFLVITSYMAYSRRGLMLLLLPCVYVVFAVLTSYAQTRGFYLISALLLWVYAARLNLSRTMVIAIVSVVVLAALAVLLTFDSRDYRELYYTDFNTAWRLRFWLDVFRSTWLTHGIGVGFGTEGLVNVYPDMPRPIFIPNPANNPDFIMIGTHNAFTDALLRCGILGFASLIWIFARSARVLQPRYTPGIAISFCGAFLCAFVNVALQSPLYSAGIAFALGYCRAMQDTRSGVLAPALARTQPMPKRTSQPHEQR